MGDVVLLGAVHTPFGALHGALAGVHPVSLLARTLHALATRTDVPLDAIGEVVAGAVEQVGAQGGNLGRAAVLAAGWPVAAGGATLDQAAISGVAALAHVGALVAAGAIPVGVAAAVDVPSLVPPGAAAMGRYPYGRPWDGAAGPHPMVPAGRAAEQLDIERARQDAWATASRTRARTASATPAGLIVLEELARDELLEAWADAELATVPPMFDDDGTVTAANAAAPADGAAAVLVADAAWAERAGLTPLATLHVALRGGATDDLLGAALAAVARHELDPAHVAAFELPESTGALAVALADALGVTGREPAVNALGGALATGDPMATASLRSVATLAHRLAPGTGEIGLAVAAGPGVGSAVVLRARP